MKAWLAVFSFVILIVVFSLFSLAGLGAIEAGKGSVASDTVLAETSSLIKSRWDASRDPGEKKFLETISASVDKARALQSGWAFSGHDRSRGLFAFIVLVSGAAFLAVAALWVFTFSSIVRPLSALRDAMRDDLESDSPIPAERGVREVVELRESFVDLRSRLAEYRNRVRTAERETIGRFLVHEIRNALTPVSPALRLARGVLAPKPIGDEIDGHSATLASKALLVAEEQVESVQSLLERFRLTYKFPTPRMAPVDLGLLAKKLPECLDRRVSIEMKGDSFTVMADAGMVSAAIGNLVRNALEACDEKPGSSVTVSLEKNVNRITLGIKDTAGGIAGEIMENLFEEWVTTKKKGMGLGLPFVKRVFDAHGYSLTVETSADGTSFRADMEAS